MKIFLYSDLHISRTSSILPLTSSENKYTYRQKMIIDTGIWISNAIKQLKPDLIINLGDTYDKHTITSYDINTATKFFECFDSNIKHYVLVGNHEMINNNFNAVSLLNNISNITVIDEPCTIDNFAFLPYCDYKSILQFPEGDFLFSHNDIQGSSIRGDFVLPEGIDQQDLKKYKLVFNGHIHKPSIMNNIINVGSVTTHSFSDDENSVPQCYLFDTETLNLTTLRPNCCPLFRKFDIKLGMESLEQYINRLDKNYKYILHVICPFELKDEVKTYLDQNEYIISARINTKIDKSNEVIVNKEIEEINLQNNVDIKQTFKQFLDTIDLKYPKELYQVVMEGVD